MSSNTTPFKPLDGRAPGDGPEVPSPYIQPTETPKPKPKATRTPRPQPSVTPSVSNPRPSPSPRSPQLSGIRIGANQQYQLGKQGVVGAAGSFQLGSALTANNAAVTGRANGSLTQGGWTQGAASGNFSGGPRGTASFVNNGNYGATASGLSGISSDRGFRR
jgi:hypothetical protein